MSDTQNNVQISDEEDFSEGDFMDDGTLERHEEDDEEFDFGGVTGSKGSIRASSAKNSNVVENQHFDEEFDISDSSGEVDIPYQFPKAGSEESESEGDGMAPPSGSGLGNAGRSSGRNRSDNKELDNDDEASSDGNPLDESERRDLDMSEEKSYRGYGDDDFNHHTPDKKNAYRPEEYAGLDVGDDVKELFEHIGRYIPQTVEIELTQKPFIPDFIPAVGDVDCFIKVPRPDGEPELLGLTAVDEPCLEQSDPAVLELQLRAAAKRSDVAEVDIRSIENAHAQPKLIEQWIQNIEELHRNKPLPSVHYTRNMPDTEELMKEWPGEFENILQQLSLPPADIDLSVNEYAKVCCSLLDIPTYPGSLVESLHMLFSLYLEFKQSQHFGGV
eukprot:GCRY01003849.1.p1 GENE.GCRY01003849.1~~GCRY01003849.1.p1  ORF type:complete len:387 (+),score=120.77 GCRY01003849.1:136-1296(+)